ncbi:sodium:calcium antiporter [Nanoarchaeota archaeon]
MLWIDILLLIVSVLVMIGAGTVLVRSLTKIATFLKLSGFVIGFIIMAFATSIPELFVGITSAIAKTPALALGTVIGANIIDLTLVIGVAIILSRGIKIESSKTKKDSLYMFGIASVAMVLTFLGNELSRIDGAILILLFFWYAKHLIREGHVFKQELENKIKRWEVVRSVALFIIALVILFYSASFVVGYAGDISFTLGVPPVLIGLLLIALSTTLPELVFTTKAVRMGQSSLALGDLIGSVVVNSTLVLGVTALIFPISAHYLTFLVSALFMITVAFIFATYTSITKRLGWRVGTSLILLYVLFLITEVYLRTIA